MSKIHNRSIKLTTKLFSASNVDKSVLKQYAVITAIWTIFTLALIVLFIIYAYEMSKMFNTSVTVTGLRDQPDQTHTVSEWRKLLPDIEWSSDQQNIYRSMVKTVFGTSQNVFIGAHVMPLVWFSCMFFIPNFSTISNWQTLWESKLLSVTTSEIYILISTLLAIVGLGMNIYLLSQYGFKLHQSNKLGFTHKYPLYKTDLILYSVTTYANFVIAISIFFSFYALSATIVMLIYMLLIKSIYKKIEEINDAKNICDNIFRSSDLSYFKTLFIVMAVMIGYSVANSIITSELNVDVNSVLSGLFSTGGIAVIIVSLVKNLLSSSITEVNKKMKNIDNQIKQIKFFYHVRKGESAFDYEFAQILPPIIKKVINTTKDIKPEALRVNFEKLFEYTDFFSNYKYKKNKISNSKNRNFMLYLIYNKIDNFDEIEDIKANLLKVQEKIKKTSTI